ncbi:hypothetical protein GUITHDRAFT_105765 [Guillardia theta CCMP2712]|uniref:Uncharacterized protein n=1 Tax=Guillardia theta (strain CCMP2712) TaxID=905079 RepID=L1JJE4_GUITC|nr:hypothetical protein GUITHDRAFT_105765 [Guillardia theta CCMP2712]EKX48621.1 hypothetical protein GUITHDRAFT_105765 [Guillardia theta CCMP2712]|eukprot:XP_005835601.1 hypothetical protein GUITHDRAFT_105765 [Guillardia theta CCMP2712]
MQSAGKLAMAAAMAAATLAMVDGFALNGGMATCVSAMRAGRSSCVSVRAGRRSASPTMAEDFSASRRNVLFGLGAAAFLFVSPAHSKDAINDCEKWAPGRKWITGKSCQEKGSNEVKGTKKDPKYLRSIQNCRNEYCTTYEQCTYQIGPKEDYGGFVF